MYRKYGRSVLVVYLTLLTSFAQAGPDIQPYVDNVFNSQKLAVFPPAAQWTEGRAYRFQEALDRSIQVRGQRLIGYKVALTHKQRPFGAPEPIYGRLYDFNLLSNGATLSLSQFTRPLMELELAFKFTRSLLPPFSLESLKGAISYVAPAVEFPDFVYNDPKEVSWQEAVMSGVGIRRVIIGTPKRIGEIDVNQLRAKARWNDEPYTRGYGNDVLGDQWQSLLYLAKKLQQRGYHIKSGDWVLSGSMNVTVPLRLGNYQVDYGELGDLYFQVAEQRSPADKPEPALYINGEPVVEIK